ncbi:MAG TPA: 16S rRNA (uracil(1498)-N(3))-methyltransferase [Pyrinomonadaceae bacterium]|nr:16S rRNA (uracil(1498)-N(3))-methyltransferase [Pyrinomonadaceae bacterium]
MTRRRFYAPPNAFSPNRSLVQLEADEARHLRDVLRLQSGDQVNLFDGEGREFDCKINHLRRDYAELTILAEVEPAKPESQLDLTLGIALLKGEKFDLVVQKATELGVVRIVPLMTQRADVRLREEKNAEKRVTRWQRIAQEAAKQSGRATVPEVTEPSSFAAFVKEDFDGLRIMFSERDGQTLNEAVEESQSVLAVMAVIVLVGSEGGWTDEELVLARDGGWKIVTLGGRILRAETAGIVVTALLQNLLGDLR